MSTHASARRGLIGTLAAGLIATPLALGFTTPVQANPAGTDLVIKEVYGAGGNSGAVLNADFVELYNPTASAIALAGKTLQYRSAGGGVGGTVTLAGSVPANSHFLVQMSAAGTTGAALPAPDQVADPAIGMAGAGGQVILGTATTYGSGNLAGAAGVIDAFGTSGATSFEGAAAGSPASGTQSLNRTATGADTDNNTADFTLAAPTPTASGVTTPPPGPDPEPQPGTVRPIAEIQGTGATTPFSGQAVTTEGVVTAAYPTGGLNGFYLQTPGADTANASDAVFVYGGTSGFTTYPAVGSSVRVTGTAGEFSGATQITASNAGVTPVASLGTVTPKTQVPGTDCALPGTACLTGAALDAAREVAEGESFRPTAAWTATDVYDFGPFYNDGSNGSAMRGEIGLAADSTKPLVAPTEIIDAQATALRNERIAYNNAHRIVLDDGSSLTYSTTANSGSPFPWVTAAHAVRVGAAVTFPAPVIFTVGFNQWRLQPTSQVVGAPSASQPQFAQTRAQNLAPQDVGGDVKLATFNVLNFFPTTGEEFDALPDTTCSYFTDRSGTDRISVNSCNPNGPRGAANDANLVRQRDKIVAAINTAGADVVSLEELENSVKFGKDRDFAINALVTALNAAAGAGTWAAVPSPAASELPAVADQDVIRNGFIYKPAKVALVGTSDVLGELSTGTAAFSDAREPVAQAFKKVGGRDADAFGVIVNHFKSKGSGTPDPDGQGNANDRRVLQANALVTFADQFKAARGITRIFLAGDFNAYTEEDPIQVLNAAGYAALKSTSDPEEKSYNFDGQIGSLDHVLANAAAQADITGVDIWTINSYESVYYEYSRFNTNVTNLYAPNPFRSSDHNPEIVGINAVGAEPATRTIQILGTNDFHGRLLNNAAGAPGSTTGSPAGPNTSVDQQAGAAILSGAVKQLRAQNPDTVFAAAGDLIGASTFESFIQNDEPTIDALNAAGLQVSAAGNHEFDQGYEDLVGRVQARANWEYLAANIEEPAGRDELAESWTQDFGKVTVGFVGAVTEDLPSLVSPDGIQGVTVTDIVAATNREADALEAAGADLVVLLVHEGASSTDCATMDDDPTSAFGSIINGVNDKVDAIVSGHTHLAYSCSFPVAGWSDRPVKERPVVSAGQYGTNLNQLLFTVDTATGQVQAKTQALLPLKASTAPFTANYPSDSAVASIVADAITKAGPLGAVPVGKIAAPFSRAKFATGNRENRGGESTLGNLVAEIQRWATRNPESGAAQIALMNPGGLRADLVGTAADGSRTVTYREAANVQPFANTLVNMDLTGAQLETVLEQQWQTNPNGSLPSRPFLKLGQSEGFEYTYYTYSTPRADNPALNRTAGEVTSMKLNGVEIVPSRTYSVTVNSFLASGGDNFRELANGTSRQDTGKADLQAQVDYFEQVVGSTALRVDYSQRAVGVTFAPGRDNIVAGGESLTFDLSSLIMTGSAGGVTDPKDATVEVSLGGVALGSFPVDGTVPNPGTGTGEADSASTDESGKATVTITLPRDLPQGLSNLQINGRTTGTELLLPIIVPAETAVSAPSVSVAPGEDATVEVTVTSAGDTGTRPTGAVTARDGQTQVDAAQVVGGKATLRIPASALEAGDNVLSLTYSGDETHRSSTGSVTVRVTDAPAEELATSVTGSASPVEPGQSAAVQVTVDATDSAEVPSGTVELLDGDRRVGSATLANGSARITVPASALQEGSNVFTLSYSGNDRFLPSTGAVTVTVTATTPEPEPELATPSVSVRHTPSRVVEDRTRAQLVVVVRSEGDPATGFVQVRVAGKTYVRKLADGRLTLRLPKFSNPGVKKVFVKYGGNATTEGRTATHTIRVVRR